MSLTPYQIRLNSTDRKIRLAAFREAALSNNGQQVRFLFKHIRQHKGKHGNDLALLIKTIEKFGSKAAGTELIEEFDWANAVEKKLIVGALAKMSIFHNPKRIHPFAENLWALLYCCSSEQLRSYVAMTPAEFAEELAFAWRTTSHWRRK